MNLQTALFKNTLFLHQIVLTVPILAKETNHEKKNQIRTSRFYRADNRIRLCADRTAVQANVQVYELTPKGMQQVDDMRGTAKSGRKPGMGEMMGVGAIAGHLLASTLVSGALAAGTEMTSATVEADGKRLADQIATDLGKFFVDQGWIPPEALKKSIL